MESKTFSKTISSELDLTTNERIWRQLQEPASFDDNLWEDEVHNEEICVESEQELQENSILVDVVLIVFSYYFSFKSAFKSAQNGINSQYFFGVKLGSGKGKGDINWMLTQGENGQNFLTNILSSLLREFRKFFLFGTNINSNWLRGHIEKREKIS